MQPEAFILAAGFGTRLRPLTEYRPKPLVPICGVPLLSYALHLCNEHGIRKAFVNAHHLHEQLESWNGLHEGVEVEVLHEAEILGTGGGLKAVQDRIAERIVVLNGDVLHDVDLRRLIAVVPDGGGVLVLRPNPEDAANYGHVSADTTGCIVQMRDFASTTPRGEVRKDTHFTGIHALHRNLLDDAEAGFSDILRTAYKARIGQRRIRGVRYRGPWLDIGDPAVYLDTNFEVLAGRVALALDPFTRAERGSSDQRLWIGPGAVIHPDAQLDHAIIGAGARVGPVKVQHSVVWDGVEVDQDLDRAIAHDGGILQV